jgi:TPR repeat protein
MLARPKTIYVDVDGTLILKNGTVNTQLINFLENMSEANGGDYQLILWSMAGHAHAEEVAEELKITHLFEHILTKPGYMIDDDGKNWLRFTHLITPEFYKGNSSCRQVLRDSLIAEAEAGDAEAQYKLSRIYKELNMEIHYADELKWLRKAAAQGHTDAQIELGSAYHLGKIVALDRDLGNEWVFMAKRTLAWAEPKSGNDADLITKPSPFDRL